MNIHFKRVPHTPTIIPNPTIIARYKAEMHANEQICTLTKKVQSRIHNLTISITKAPRQQSIATKAIYLHRYAESFCPRLALALISLHSTFLSFFCAVRIFTISLHMVATAVKKSFLFAFIYACSALSTIAFAYTSSSTCFLTTMLRASEARRTPPFPRGRRLPVRQAFRAF